MARVVIYMLGTVRPFFRVGAGERRLLRGGGAGEHKGVDLRRGG